MGKGGGGKGSIEDEDERTAETFLHQWQFGMGRLESTHVLANTLASQRMYLANNLTSLPEDARMILVTS